MCKECVEKYLEELLDFTEHLNSWKSQCYIFKCNLVTFFIFLELLFCAIWVYALLCILLQF